MNPRCPICGYYELNDGSEETLWTCECDEADEQTLACDFCGIVLDSDGDRFWECENKIYCEDCLPKDFKKIGARH